VLGSLVILCVIDLSESHITLVQDSYFFPVRHFRVSYFARCTHFVQYFSVPLPLFWHFRLPYYYTWPLASEAPAAGRDNQYNSLTSLTAVGWFIRCITTVVTTVTEVGCCPDTQTTSVTFEQVVIVAFYTIKSITSWHLILHNTLSRLRSKLGKLEPYSQCWTWEPIVVRKTDIPPNFLTHRRLQRLGLRRLDGTASCFGQWLHWSITVCCPI